MTVLPTRRAWMVTIFVAAALISSSSVGFAQSVLPQFHHSSWNAEEGIGAIYDIRQAADGFLWLQTSTGVFRFDGVRFQTAAEVTHEDTESVKLDAVLPSAFGGEWFTTRTAGLLLWKDGNFTSFPETHCTGRIVEAPDHTLWVASRAGLFHVQNAECKPVGRERGYPGGEPAGLMVDREGTVWVKMWSGPLLSLAPGQPSFVPSQFGLGLTQYFAFLHEAPNGEIWLSDDYGLRQVRGKLGSPTSFREAGAAHHKGERFGDFDFAADGSIWISTDQGLRWAPRPEQWRTSQEMESSPGENFTVGNGLSSDTVWTVLVDREGNTWVGTDSGLEQLRRVAVNTPRLPASQEHEYAIASGDQGSVWTGSLSLPLTHLFANGEFKSFPLINQITSLKRARDGTVWVAGQGDFRLGRSSGDVFTQVHYPREEQQAVISLAVDRNRGLWISLRQVGVYHLINGTWSNEDGSIGKERTNLGAMTDDASGNVWFAYSNNLVRWDGNQYTHFSSPESQGNIAVSTIAVRGDHVWLAGDGGVQMYSSGKFELLHCKDKRLPGRVSGVVETTNGDLWMNGPSGITHIAADQIAKWIRDPAFLLAADRLNQLDGLPGLSGEEVPTPSVVQSLDRLLWFATTKGIAWLDPETLDNYRNHMPPPVVISSVSSNGNIYSTQGVTQLPPHTRNLEIDYTALSMAVPQRVSFRYKLDEIDEAWQDAGTRRQAFYSDLPPGRYHFRVAASNNDGVWNDAGATLLFTVTPAFYQTWWFRTLLAIAAAIVIWLLVRLRIRLVLRELQGRLAERLEERERIARELHDTLLQGLFGLMLRLQFSLDQLAEDNPVRVDITRALNQSDSMMQEGRERIKHLRGGHMEGVGLAQALELFGQELQSISPVQFHVEVEGSAHPIDAYIHEEILLIGREALTNAFRHSGASAIAVEITYRFSALQLRVHDNGCGVDKAVLAAGGRENHWGLTNMRERARKMHGTLRVEVPSKGGTTVELRVPASVVYKTDGSFRRRLWSGFRKTPDTKSTSPNVQAGRNDDLA
jgi:signal transduction histidine kinase/ligand-binding sensor domain-containing protein